MSASDNAASRVQRVLALKTFPGFAHLPPKDVGVLAENLRPRFFPRGAILLREGLPVRGFHMIVDGKVHMLRKGVPYRTFTSKDVVGGLAAMTKQPQPSRVVAAEDTITLEFDSDDMEEVFEDNFNILTAVLRALAKFHLELRKDLGESCGYPPVNEAESFPEVGDLWLVERMKVLRRTLPFASVSIEAIANIAQSAEERRIEPGTTVWWEGDPSGHNVTLLSGIVGCATADGKHRFRFGAGTVIGAIDSAAQVPRWYTAVAETKVVTLSARTETLVDFMEDHPQLAMEMLRMNGRMVTMLLERLAEKNADSEGSTPPVELPSHAVASP